MTAETVQGGKVPGLVEPKKQRGGCCVAATPILEDSLVNTTKAGHWSPKSLVLRGSVHHEPTTMLILSQKLSVRKLPLQMLRGVCAWPLVSSSS